MSPFVVLFGQPKRQFGPIVKATSIKYFISRPGLARGSTTNTVLINQFSWFATPPFPNATAEINGGERTKGQLKKSVTLYKNIPNIAC